MLNKTIIGTVLTLITLVGAVVGFQSYFVTKAEAQQIMVTAERGNIETELKLVELEIELLESYDSTILGDRQVKRNENRLEYLIRRRQILEERLIELRDEK